MRNYTWKLCLEHQTLGWRVICPSKPAYYIADCPILSYLSETNCKVFPSFKGVELEVEVSAMISTTGIAQNTFVHILRGMAIEWNKEKKILSTPDKLKVLLIKVLRVGFFNEANFDIWAALVNSGYLLWNIIWYLGWIWTIGQFRVE